MSARTPKTFVLTRLSHVAGKGVRTIVVRSDLPKDEADRRALSIDWRLNPRVAPA